MRKGLYRRSMWAAHDVTSGFPKLGCLSNAIMYVIFIFLISTVGAFLLDNPVIVHVIIAVLVFLVVSLIACVIVYLVTAPKRRRKREAAEKQARENQAKQLLSNALEAAVNARFPNWEYAVYIFVTKYGVNSGSLLPPLAGAQIFTDSTIPELLYSRLSESERIGAMGSDVFMEHLSTFFYLPKGMIINGKLLTQNSVIDIYKNGYGHFVYMDRDSYIEVCNPHHLDNYNAPLTIHSNTEILKNCLAQQTFSFIEKENAHLTHLNTVFAETPLCNNSLPIEIQALPELQIIFDLIIQAEDYNIHCYNSNGTYTLWKSSLYEASLTVQNGATHFAKLCDMIEQGIGVYATVKLHGLAEYLSYPILGRFKYGNRLLWNAPEIRDELTKKSATDIYVYLDLIMELNKFFLYYFEPEVAYFKTYDCFILFLNKFEFSYFYAVLKTIKSKRKKDMLSKACAMFDDSVAIFEESYPSEAKFIAYRKIKGKQL